MTLSQARNGAFVKLKFDTPMPVFLAVLLLLTGCAGLPPVQELSDARQTLQAAYDLKAGHYMPYHVWYAEEHLNAARDQLTKGPHAYAYARFHALQARQAAWNAYQVTGVLHEVEAAVRSAEAAGYLWLETRPLLHRAKRAARAHDPETAVKLARQAKQQAETAAIQAKIEQQRLDMQEHLPWRSSLTTGQIRRLNALKPPLEQDKRQEIIPGLSSRP